MELLGEPRDGDLVSAPVDEIVMPVEGGSELCPAQGQHLHWQRLTAVIFNRCRYGGICLVELGDIRHRGQGASIDFAGGGHQLELIHYKKATGYRIRRELR